MKNKISNLLQVQAEISRQALVLGTVLFFAGVMSVATIQLANAGTTGDTNMTQNVTAGALTLTTANGNLGFNNGALGETTSANTGTGAGNAITISDLTGSGNGWTVTGYFNTNFYKITDDNVQMAITAMSWYPAAMTVTNNTGNNAQVSKGADGAFSGNGAAASKTLANTAAGNGVGSFDLYSLGFNYTIPLNSAAASYKANLRLTIAN